MLAKLYSVRPSAWSLLVALAVLAATSAIVRSTGIISSPIFLYVIQPVLTLGVGGLAWSLTRSQRDHVRHRSEKAFMVGSIMAVWFVLYFLSGLITTYVHNSVLPSPKYLLINLWAFGAVAFTIEYARHGLMLLTGRRNLIWFGVIVALILAAQQMNFGLIPLTHGLDGFVKLGISDFIPSLLCSLLLTYLAIAGGLPSMLVLRMGLVAATIVPPIIPKFDWYLQGISLIILIICIFLAMDRTRQDKQASTRHNYNGHPKLAYDIMAVVSIVFLALFMTGVFTYKPQAIASNSMQPVFSRGSIVIVQKLHNPMDVQVGDVIQYIRSNETITHRVVAIDAAADGSGKRVFTTKGDNNSSADPPVAESQLVGIVRSHTPYIGYPSVWLKHAADSGVIK